MADEAEVIMSLLRVQTTVPESVKISVLQGVENATILKGANALVPWTNWKPSFSSWTSILTCFSFIFLDFILTFFLFCHKFFSWDWLIIKPKWNVSLCFNIRKRFISKLKSDIFWRLNKSNKFVGLYNIESIINVKKKQYCKRTIALRNARLYFCFEVPKIWKVCHIFSQFFSFFFYREPIFSSDSGKRVQKIRPWYDLILHWKCLKPSYSGYLDIPYVQEVVTQLYSNLLCKMGHYFLDTQ